MLIKLLQFQPPAAEANPPLVGLVIWIAVMVIAFFILKTNRMTKKVAIILASLSFIVGGVILRANVNPVAPILQIPLGLSAQAPIPQRIQSIMPLLLILSVLLVSGYFIGRIFCGYACPLGAIQEILSRFRFKTEARKDPNPDLVKTRKRKSVMFRWFIFGCSILGISLVGVRFVQMTNPFLGFQTFHAPSFQMLLIPFVLLLTILFASIFIYRPYCRYFCPYGALASALNKGNKHTIELGPSCKDCGLCDRVCPTNSLDPDSDKSECYYCGRCIEICAANNSKRDLDLLDHQKIADITKRMISASFNPERIDKKSFTTKIIQSLIASFPVFAKWIYFEELVDVIEGNHAFSIPHVDRIIQRLREFAPDEVESLRIDSLRDWVAKNHSMWEDQYLRSTENVHISDKIFYGAKR